jgi:DNA invertase Pin-like site-specific DNA recombinase
LQPPLLPRNGHTVEVLGIARISTDHQDQRSLADQEALYDRWLKERLGRPYRLETIASRGSGECLDRRELLDAIAAVESGRYDLVIAEDLGRIARRVHTQLFCELCEDHETRLIALNDQVDTAQENWRLLAGFASMRHEMYNADTGKRIRRSLRNRFEQGGVVQTVVYGYLKPPGAKSDADLRKDPAAEPIYQEMFTRLEGGASYSEIADWLNEKGIPPGPYARLPRWDCSLVTRLIHNPILKGVRVRNQRMSKRVNQTGRRKSVVAPASERLERHCPHLAFIEPARYDRLIAQLDERNARFRRKGIDGIDTRRNVPKKRTVWPGQHIDCGICGRPYVYGGHGQKDHLMCRGAHDYRCWNALTVDGPLARSKLSAAIRTAITGLPDFDATLVRLVEEAFRRLQETLAPRHRELAQELSKLEREIGNIVAAVRAGGDCPSLVGELRRLEAKKIQLTGQQQQLVQAPQAKLVVPSLAQIKRQAEQAFDSLAETSQEFGRLLRQWIPRIVVYPYRLCDGGHPVLRARLTLSLASLLPEGPGVEQMAPALERTLLVDLFDPPQREAYRVRVMERTARGLTQREIAQELKITLPAVQRAGALAGRMEDLGITDPYQPLTGPPEDYERLRRHQHGRYRFEPLPPKEPNPPPSVD